MQITTLLSLEASINAPSSSFLTSLYGKSNTLSSLELVKTEYLDDEQKLTDDIKSGKVKTIQDVFKVKVDENVGDLKIELNSDLQADGGFNENNPTKVILSGRSIVKSLMHETTHATQYFTRPESAEKISTGANIDHLKNAKQEVLNSIDEYVKKNFPTTYDIMTRSSSNDIPTIIYFNIDGEMQATCKLTSLLFESGFTWSRDKSILYSPDGKEHWDLTLKTEVKSSSKNNQKSNKGVIKNEQSSNVSNIVDGTVGENSTESSERVETNTNEQSKTRPSSKDIRARFEKIDGHQVKKVGKIYANIETKVDTNDSVVAEGKNVYGVNVFYYSGTVYDEDGEQHAARGFTDGKNIYITKGLSKNAAKKVLKHEYFHIKKRQNRELFNELKDKLNINSVNRIEIFDNSNLFGNFNVSGMVVFIDGKKNTNLYRKFKITNDKNDDYGTMREVIYRRYFRVLKDNLERPDLIIVDGGIGQVNIAREVLMELGMDIHVAGLKKDDKHSTNVLVGGYPLHEIEIKKDSYLFLLLTRMQDEVHRYTISYHKDIRSKGAISSILDNIDGIGEVRKKNILKKYRTIPKMKEASIEELSELMPKNIAIDFYNYLRNVK